jgi:hypothetical protein
MLCRRLDAAGVVFIPVLKNPSPFLQAFFSNPSENPIVNLACLFGVLQYMPAFIPEGPLFQLSKAFLVLSMCFVNPAVQVVFG